MSRLHRDIAALADGSHEDADLRERIAASPELTALFAEQERAVAVTRAVRPPAPPALRAAVAGASRPAAAPARPRRPMLGFLVAAAGVIALTVVAVLPSGSAPSVTTVASLAVRGPAAPAPPADPAHQSALRAQIDGVRYPDWKAFGWPATGARTDQIDGRATRTVYYAARGATVGYTIVAGTALPEPSAVTTQLRDGTRFLGLTRGGRSIVTWRRSGHTCVVSAAGVPIPTLLRLAEWRYDAIPA